MKFTLLSLLLLPALAVVQPVRKPVASDRTVARQKNIVFILSDDHRYDAMGFMNKIAGLQTPNLDRLARDGAHVQNAFALTARPLLAQPCQYPERSICPYSQGGR